MLRGISTKSIERRREEWPHIMSTLEISSVFLLFVVLTVGLGVLGLTFIR
jgi:hypothetical protein